MAEFGENNNFVKMINLARRDSQVLDALWADDQSLIDAYPGLSVKERKLLKGLNWKNIILDVTDDDVDKFSPLAAGTVCESKVASEVAERKCYKLWLNLRTPTRLIPGNWG